MSAKGILIASAVATLFLTGAAVARADEKMGGDQVRCAGINACKGQGSCASAHNECKGKNTCKGKGYVDLSSADECVKKGGKVIEPKKM